jgi:hypothetical protein
MSGGEFLLLVWLLLSLLAIYEGVRALLQTDEKYAATTKSRLRSNAKLDGARSEEEIQNYLKNWKGGPESAAGTMAQCA